MQIETENSQKTKIIQEFTITYQPENRLALHPIVLEKFSIVEKPSLIPSLEVSDNPLLYKNQSDDCQSPNSPYSLISASDQSPIDQSYFSISQQNSDYKNQPIIRRSNRLAIKKIEKGKSKKSTNNLKRKRKTKRNSYENTSEVLETDHYESYRSKREKRS